MGSDDNFEDRSRLPMNLSLSPTAGGCPCGEDHTGSLFWPVVRDLIEAFGATIFVTIAECTYAVPRVWIAFHGIKGSEIVHLANQYGWTRIFSGSDLSGTDLSGTELSGTEQGDCES